MKRFEWAIIGSGISGVVAAEILTREGHSAVLIEKNEQLSAETTRDFHEWIHTGSLYTLIPDKLTTLKFILGAIDDLLEFYSSFENMNLTPTESGLEIATAHNGWFQNNKIHFKFRTKSRKFVFPWLFGIARAIFLINKIKKHDWLRRRAGETDPFKLKIKEIIPILKKLYANKDVFFNYKTADFTSNSRIILKDLLSRSVSNGLEISTSNEFLNFKKKDDEIVVNCSNESFIVNKIVLGISGNISKFVKAEVRTSYAPMAVVKNIEPNTNSFVELDYYPKNCINIINKGDGIGLIGGISFSKESKCMPYIEEVIKKHMEYNPNLIVLHKYNGIKNEIIFKDQPRNYLYHILNISENVWGIIPGKFTLGFSIAPEFYRRVYKKNPRKHLEKNSSNGFNTKLLSNTVWYDAVKKYKIKEI